MSGFKFSECKANPVLSVCEFRLEKSEFDGSVSDFECSAILAMVETIIGDCLIESSLHHLLQIFL